MSKVSYTADNLVTATKPLITVDVLQLEAGVVVRGEVLKKGTTGLVKLTATSDTPYAVALENIDASGSAKKITYSYDCSVKASELVFGAGALANFRDKFVTSTSILVQE